ncbi:MAG: hypothetical protein HZLCBSQH_001249, partial [Candidatus Fervidibacterota bacterium]
MRKQPRIRQPQKAEHSPPPCGTARRQIQIGRQPESPDKVAGSESQFRPAIRQCVKGWRQHDEVDNFVDTPRWQFHPPVLSVKFILAERS